MVDLMDHPHSPLGSDASVADSVAASVAASVANDVIQGLYNGRYEPGQRLYEADLAKIYGVSRGPVREALNKLAAKGLVELTLQRGARVIMLSIDEAIDTLVVTQTLVSLAARLAAETIDAPGARAKMEAAAAELSRFAASDTEANFALARSRFYTTLAHLANNTQLKLLLPSVRIHIIRVQYRSILTVTDSRRHSDYHRMTQAVLAGHARDAERAVRIHFDRAIKALCVAKL